jgi:dihydroceramide fatty acyl 2-hydroxylase
VSAQQEGMTRTEALKASPPMFESRLLDACSRVHPSVPVILFAPAIAILFVLGVERVGTGRAVLLAVGGYLLWTLTEYWMHRIVFHFEPEEGIGARLHWMVHGVHHDHPTDPMRLVMPPAASIPLAALVLAALWAVAGSVHAPAVASGFLAGYLVYDEMHYALHHHVPKSQLGKRLRELHMRHHFQDDERGFGISAPYWDRVFGTHPSRERQAG